MTTYYQYQNPNDRSITLKEYRKQITCKYWISTGCNKGEQCWYNHGIKSDSIFNNIYNALNNVENNLKALFIVQEQNKHEIMELISKLDQKMENIIKGQIKMMPSMDKNQTAAPRPKKLIHLSAPSTKANDPLPQSSKHKERQNDEPVNELSHNELLQQGPSQKAGSLIDIEEKKSMPNPNEQHCTYCGEQGISLHRCSNCKKPYCNQQCQRADWKEHKKICIKPDKSRIKTSKGLPKHSTPEPTITNPQKRAPTKKQRKKQKEIGTINDIEDKRKDCKERIKRFKQRNKQFEYDPNGPKNKVFQLEKSIRAKHRKKKYPKDK